MSFYLKGAAVFVGAFVGCMIVLAVWLAAGYGFVVGVSALLGAGGWSHEGQGILGGFCGVAYVIATFVACVAFNDWVTS